MIDTDKYEGHTPAPWRIVEPSPGEQHHFYRIESETEFDEMLGHNTWVAHTCVIHEEDDDSRNTFLIADAPLLLQEVKRLRADNALYLACIHSSQFREKPGSAMSKLNQMRFLQRGEEE